MFSSRIATIVFLLMMAAPLHAQDRNPNYRQTRTTAYQHTTIHASYDTRTDRPVWVYNAEALNTRGGSIHSSHAATRRGRAFFTDHAGFFGIDIDHFEMTRVDKDASYWFVSFRQVHEGVPVLGSEAGVTFHRNGTAVAAGAYAYPGITLNTAPSLSAPTAIAAAQQAAESPGNAVGMPTLWVVPSEENELTYQLAWAVPLVGTDVETHLIDAHNGAWIRTIGGALSQSIEESIVVPASPAPPISAPSATIEGYVTFNYTTSPDDPYGTLEKHYDKPFKYAKVKLTQGNIIRTTYADANGFYRFNGLVFGASHTVTFEMANDRAYILSGIPLARRQKSKTVTTDAAIKRVDYDWGWGDDGDNNSSGTAIGLNTVYHVREMYTYVKNRLNYSGMDQYGLIKVRVQGGKTAYTGYPSYHHITIDGSFGRSDEVIMHEYSHIFINKLSTNLNGTMGSSMHEGLADFFTCAEDDDYTFGGPVGTATVRFCHNLFTMDDFSWSSKYIHNNGRILSGGLWFARSSYNAAGNLTKKDAEKLAYRALQASPKAKTYSDFYDRLIWADKAYFSQKGKYHLEDRFIFRKFGWPLVPAVTSLGTYTQGTEIKWIDKSKKESGYRILRAFNNGSYSAIATLPANTTSFWDGDVDCGAQSGTWWYRVEAFATVGGSVGETSGDDGGYDTETPCNTTYASQSPDAFTASHQAEIPSETALLGAYPNPFNPAATIGYTLHQTGTVNLEVYNLQGKRVAHLVQAEQAAGYHSVHFDAAQLPSGIYLVRMQAHGRTSSQTITYLK